MTSPDSGRRKSAAAARAEAAAWIARLHGPNRTKEVEIGLRRWLADDPQNPLALELLTDTWERSALLRRRPLEYAKKWESMALRRSLPATVLAAMAAAVVAVVGTLLYMQSDVVSTGNGELRTLMLQDGSRVYMNADTRLKVSYGRSAREVRLQSGEAFFEVAKNPHWPFVVTAAGHRIRALGTEFDVRDEARLLSVTLVEGKVTVSAASVRQAIRPPSAPGTPPDRGPSAANLAGSSVFTLAPGQRLTLPATGQAEIDRPPLDLVTAWERGQVVLDDVSLADAVAEMNRYSRRRIVVDDPEAMSIRVSGIFEAGDSANFAAAVAESYHLRATFPPNGAILLGPAVSPGS